MDNIMDKVVRRCRSSIYRIHHLVVFLLVIVLLINNCSSFGVGVVAGNDENTVTDDQRQAESRMPIIDGVKTLFSLPLTPPHLWFFKLKSLLQQGWPYFPHPNLDFRGGSGGGEGMTAGKVKEAAAKSIDKSKETVEESAKSAANKLKKTLSEKVAADHEAEL